MQTKLPTSCRKYIHEDDGNEEEEESKEKSVAGEETEVGEFDDIIESVQYKNLRKGETTKQGISPETFSPIFLGS